MFIFFLLVATIIVLIICSISKRNYRIMETNVLRDLGMSSWDNIPYYDTFARAKSRQSLEKYDIVHFFKEHRFMLDEVKSQIIYKAAMLGTIQRFLADNPYRNQSRSHYRKIVQKLDSLCENAVDYRICVQYISAAGNNLGEKVLIVKTQDVARLKNDPSLLMTKSEYSQYMKEVVAKKQHEYYERVNAIIDYANQHKDFLIIKNCGVQLDGMVAQLINKTLNSISKIKSVDSGEWGVIENYIEHIKDDMENIVARNKRILEYYESKEFLKVKETCEALMSSQREFNEYINEKVESISALFGTRVVRNETAIEDEYSYIRPYQKTVTPFAAEVSAAVFASAENNPLDYVVKYFYPNKSRYTEQIGKLHILIEELETLREAKQIIENYKKEYQQYLGDVPSFVMENDEAGFYSRLGFATIDESVLNVEYKFSYTSGGGMAQRSFTVPMTEETIAELIKALESKLSTAAFAKAQRAMMTRKLRDFIKTRDNYTCCNCGNSTYEEPNLLLEIDHIIPVSKGGHTSEENLQTLCWKCNRAKSNK